MSEPAQKSFNKKRVLLCYLSIFLVAGGIGLYFRLFPLRTHASFDSTEKASLVVIANIRKQLSIDIQQGNPFMSTAQKQKLLNETFNQLLKNNRDNIQDAIRKAAQDLDRHSPGEVPQQYPYLLASDSYYYYFLTERIMETGSISDTFKGSKYYHNLMLAPLGFWEPINLHPFVGLGVARILQFARPDWPLMFCVSFTPLILFVLSLILLLIVSRILMLGLPATLLGSIYFACSPIFLKRSMFGWYDDDPYNIFFPLLILALLLYGLLNSKTLKSKLFFSCLSAFSLALYALFWHGWMFLEIITLASLLAAFLCLRFWFKEKAQAKDILAFFAAFLGCTILGIAIIFGIKEFFVLFQEGYKALGDFLNTKLSLWPDLYIAVGELHRSSLKKMVSLTQNLTFFIIAFLGLGLLAAKIIKKQDAKYVPAAFILILLALASVVLTLGAQRFALLNVVPLSLAFILGADWLFKKIMLIFSRFKSQWIKKFKVAKLLQCILLCLLVIPMLKATNREVPTLLNKIFNDVWRDVLIKIKNETPQDSIINTWWSPGHFIKAWAKRSVTFDGATINVPQAYWMANIFLSNNEKKALGLLRLLNNGGNKPAEFLVENGFSLSSAVELLKQISILNKDQAKEILMPLIGDKKSQELLDITHALPPPSYLLLTRDLVINNMQIALVGRWDIAKIEELNKSPQLKKLMPSKRHLSQYVNFIWDVAGGRPRDSGALNLTGKNDEKLFFDEGVMIDLKTKTANIKSNTFGQGQARNLLFIDDSQHLVEKINPRAKLNYSVLLVNRKSQDYCILCERFLAHSLLFHLFHFEGKGLKYFKLFDYKSDLTRRNEIYVFEVKWQEFLKDLN